nr:hypothetical protein [Tanacetum cinerariifolium]
LLPKAVSDFATPVIQSTIKNALEKTPLLIAQPSSQAQSSLKAAKSKEISKKKDRDGEDPSARPNHGKKAKKSITKEFETSKKSSTSKESSKGKSPAKTSKSGKFVIAEKPVEEPVFEMSTDDVAQAVDDVANDPWFNQMVSAAKDPLTLDELMAFLVDFSNPEGDRYPFDLTKPLPLKGRPGHLTVAAKYFFNNDLEFLKSSYPKKKYDTSITKTNAVRYDIVGIEDMVPMLWNATKFRHNKDAEKRIKHWGERHKLWRWWGGRRCKGMAVKIVVRVVTVLASDLVADGDDDVGSV